MIDRSEVSRALASGKEIKMRSLCLKCNTLDEYKGDCPRCGSPCTVFVSKRGKLMKKKNVEYIAYRISKEVELEMDKDYQQLLELFTKCVNPI